MLDQLIKQAESNEIIVIPNGSYEINEPLMINKPIKIVGDNCYIYTTKPINIFEISGLNKVEILGLVIDAQHKESVGIFYQGINVDSASSCLQVANCTFKGFGTGIVLEHARESRIYKNDFYVLGQGIRTYDAVNPVINNNLFVNWGEDTTGINIGGEPNSKFSCGARITNNTLIGLRNGISVLGNDYVDISHNMIDYCKFGIILASQDQAVVANNYIGALKYGMFIEGTITICQHIKILGNNIVTYTEGGEGRTGIKSINYINGLIVKDNSISFYDKVPYEFADQPSNEVSIIKDNICMH